MSRAARCTAVLMLPLGLAHGDSWAPPEERDYFSSSGRCVAHVTPARDDAKATLEVFEVTDAGRTPQWRCVLGNEGAPETVLVSDDGSHVATINEWSRRVHGGMGDHVVAFYNKEGKIRNYSLEQALGYPDRIDKKAFDALVQQSVSGRSWVTDPMFLDRDQERLLLCVWLLHGNRWLAWEVSSGSEVAGTDAMVRRWEEKGREWARRVVSKKERPCVAALCLLGRHKRPEDRPVIESFLASDDFRSWYDQRDGTFIGLNARSFHRDLAEQLLAVWDGRDANALERWNRAYHYLGIVAGRVELPRAPRDGDGHLCIYLLPGTTVAEDWLRSVPVHRVTVYFWKYTFSSCDWPGAAIRFRIEGVTPGTYRVKAVWDKAKPLTFGDDYIRGPLAAGDCENAEAPAVTVRAGERVDGVLIDCRRDIAGPPR